MLVEYYAHSCFVLTAGRVRVMLDPYGPETGYHQPLRGAHLTLVSHDHFDHNHTAGVVGRSVVLRGCAPREQDGVKVRGVLAEHGGGLGPVTCFCLELDDLRVCHLSDLGVPLTGAQVEAIGPVDLLLVPCGGGGFTLDGKGAWETVRQLKPRWSMPMHYRTPFTNRERFPDLEGVDNFVRQAGKVEMIRSGSVELGQCAPGPLVPSHMF